MKWSDLSGLLGKAAPLVGSVIGGKAGGVMGAMVAKALGVENTPNAVAIAMKSDPDAAIKLQALENDDAQHIREMQVETLKAELSDVQDARASHSHSKMPAAICIMLTIMTAAMLAGLMYLDIPTENAQTVNMVFGSVLTQWAASIAYWVGTTRSSGIKTLLANKSG